MSFRTCWSLDLNLVPLLGQAQQLIGLRNRNGDDDLITASGCSDGQLSVLDLADWIVFGGEVQELNRLELEGVHGW